jgi:hypothetical protein
MTPFFTVPLLVTAFSSAAPAQADLSREQIQSVADQAIRDHAPSTLRLQSLRTKLSQREPLTREEALELTHAQALSSDEIGELRFGMRYGFQNNPEINKALLNLAFQRSFEADRERWLDQHARPRTMGHNPKLQNEVHAFIAANFEAIEVIIGAASGGNPHLQSRKRAEVEAFLYLLAEKGYLQTLGPDLLSTTLFLMFDLTNESNPFAAGVINLGDSKDDLLVRVGFVHFLGALFYDWMDRALPKPLANLAQVLVKTLEWIAVSQNNSFIKEAGLPLIRFKVYRQRTGSRSHIDLYAYPVSTSDIWSGRFEAPRHLGLGLVFTSRFHTAR